MEILDRFREIVSVSQTGERAPIVFEAGACDGYHTDLLCKALEERVGEYCLHAFEPCLSLANPLVTRNALHFPNLRFVPAALGSVDGWVEFFQSSGHSEVNGIRTESFYGSSSLKPPGTVTSLWPMSFEKSCCLSYRLDTYCREHGVPLIDFIWADIQGAEKDLIVGGQQILKSTRYLYTEINIGGMYQDSGYSSVGDLLGFLPGRWQIKEDYGGDVLFANLDFDNGGKP